MLQVPGSENNLKQDMKKEPFFLFFSQHALFSQEQQKLIFISQSMCCGYSTITGCAYPDPQGGMEGAIAGRKQGYDGTSWDIKGTAMQRQMVEVSVGLEHVYMYSFQATYKQILALTLNGLAQCFHQNIYIHLSSIKRTICSILFLNL